MDDRKAASKAPPRNSAITGWTSTRSLARPSNLNRIGFIGDWNGGVREGWSDGRETSWWGPANNRRTRNLWFLILSCFNPPAFAWFFCHGAAENLRNGIKDTPGTLRTLRC